MKTTGSLATAMLVTVCLLLAAATAGTAAIQVELNGSPLALSAPPVMVAGRTMVPMRSIFEALGAHVQWTSYTQTVLATRDTTTVQLTIGALSALVNGHPIALDVAPLIYAGATMVPLRFVSEALGADVRWNDLTQTVSILTTASGPAAATASAPAPAATAGEAPLASIPAGAGGAATVAALGAPVVGETAVIPLGTVVPVTLNDGLNSATNNVGDKFRVTVRSAQNGDAEFPLGTQLGGEVVGVQRLSGDQPGVLDLAFVEAVIPDGRTVAISGSLISLDAQSVSRTADGRVVATVKPTKDNRLKMIGIGAGAGMIIGKLLDKNMLVGGLLGAAAGYFYDKYRSEKSKPAEVAVKPGTVFGVRMDRAVRYPAPDTYLTARTAYCAAH